jgi:hypothetical protein
MCGDQAFFDATILKAVEWTLRHEFQDFEQELCRQDIILVTSLMEGDQDFIGQATSSMARELRLSSNNLFI